MGISRLRDIVPGCWGHYRDRRTPDGTISKGRMMEKKYKFINVRCSEQEQFDGHPVYRVYNNRSGAQLAILSWYKSWKQYVFSSREHCLFNDACLRDILDFLGILDKEGKG